jgi:hypothetical protein
MKELIGGLVHFAGSDVTAELTKREMENAPVTFSNKGARMMRTKAGDILIFGGTNMSVIKPVWGEVEDEEEYKAETRASIIAMETPVPDEPEPEPEKDKPKTADEIIAETKLKSDCKHEPEKLELYIQHTAKGIRYFPVCKFCGKRERYVSESKIVEGKYKGTPNEKWTEAHIANATPWIED